MLVTTAINYEADRHTTHVQNHAFGPKFSSPADVLVACCCSYTSVVRSDKWPLVRRAQDNAAITSSTGFGEAQQTGSGICHQICVVVAAGAARTASRDEERYLPDCQYFRRSFQRRHHQQRTPAKAARFCRPQRISWQCVDIMSIHCPAEPVFPRKNDIEPCRRSSCSKLDRCFCSSGCLFFE